MLTCDQCKGTYVDDLVHLSDKGKYMCSYCLGLKSPHPMLGSKLGKASPLGIDSAHRCAICGVEWVDSDNGFDTCEYCQPRSSRANRGAI